MPKKKTSKKSSEIKGLLKEFAEKSVGILVSSIEKVNFLKIIKNMSNVKEKIRKCVSSMILVFIGGIVLALGVAAYLAYMVPALGNGLSEMLVGAILIIIAVIIYKSKG
jgi:ABC-type siderophore export system fused ATPase/permease subunit